MPSATIEIPPRELTRTSETSRFPAVVDAITFIRRRGAAWLLLSLIVLVPCFWHHHIQATDLGSHVYNAWLAQLISSGQAPGLRIVPQSSNVLFDFSLSVAFKLVGPLAAERITVSIAVLIFFWGAFAFCSAAAGRPAWSVTPLLAMIAYGFMFNMGFMNLYLSVGLSLFALAIVWTGRRWDFLLLLPLCGLIWTAHLLGTFGVIAIAGFLSVLRRLSAIRQLVFTALVIALYFGLRAVALRHVTLMKPESNVYWMLGADQFVIFGRAYQWVAITVLILCVASLTLCLRRDRQDGLSRLAIWLQLYITAAIAVYFAPGGFFSTRLGFGGYLPDRASLYCAVLLACLLAVVRPARWQSIALGGVALAYFAFLYHDTRSFDRLEDEARRTVLSLPPGERVLGTFFRPAGARIHEYHVLDRACIGHCFYVANYEPASGQFRIKATPENRIVTTSEPATRQMQIGVYRVSPTDLPITELYACGPELKQVCATKLTAGQFNGQAAYDQLAAFINRGGRLEQ